ncbi:MAG: hypothetical protein ACI841_003803 [Planctomycetota bacterium]|jgi:hypothetical protein
MAKALVNTAGELTAKHSALQHDVEDRASRLIDRAQKSDRPDGLKR